LRRASFVVLIAVGIAAAWQLPATAQNAAVTAPAAAGFSEHGADTCLSCHNSPSMRVIFDTPHGQRADPESPMAQLQCEACHGPGGGHSGRRRVTASHEPIVAFGAGSETSIAERDAVCTGCHPCRENDGVLVVAPPAP